MQVEVLYHSNGRNMKSQAVGNHKQHLDVQNYAATKKTCTKTLTLCFPEDRHLITCLELDDRRPPSLVLGISSLSAGKNNEKS